ncbi:MAG TPA: flagellar motor protein MotB [Candidatus Marinimicrobia bacterium]|nr:flagellar motor protein MotB [Candidatus Neomarinimicrobiota bacterium]HRS51994.1 flagellar motor protein MotB [Candidatus Neomarinimicrobiota bacterium]HRU91877.1 flagellar motor protein MotB [Candidatus Neomarinimicrobiota bacterium]
MADETKPRHKIFSNQDTGDEEPWLVTYSDMMSLLLTFFILLFSISSIDPVKLEQIGNSVEKALGGAKPKATQHFSIKEIYDKVVDVVEQEQLKGVIEVETSVRGVSIKIPTEISFASGKADLNPGIFPILNKLAPMIAQSNFPIAIEGHTDNVPIKSEVFPSNWELSSARSTQVVRYFIGLGLPADRFRAIGYADTRPRASGKTIEEANQTEEQRAQNRRVEIIFLTIG